MIYKGQDYPFTFQARGLFRDVHDAITAAELSGQVFNLKSAADFAGKYQKVETETSDSSGTRATMKNQNGVVVNLVPTIEGRKFNLSREGIDIELKKPKIVEPRKEQRKAKAESASAKRTCITHIISPTATLKTSAMTPAKRNLAPQCRWFLASILLTSAVGFASFQAVAGETLARVQSRQLLRCGVSDGRLGFSYQEAKGSWSGLDVDFCRAVAAAVIGNVTKVKYYPLATTARFLALRSNEIDLLARNTTWTIGREAGLGVHFVGTLFYDGQGFMVARKSRIRKISDLQDAKICVLQKTTSEEHLADYFNARGWNYQPILANSTEEASKAFFAGQCSAYTGDRSDLAARVLSAPTGREGYVILSELISKEPLGPAIKRGDEEWLTLLRWILFAIIEAEERGVTIKNVRAKGQSQDPELGKFLDKQGSFAKLLGVKPGWVTRILEAVGNYGEMFERNLGQGSALKLERGPNRLWTQGGLMYAPPFL